MKQSKLITRATAALSLSGVLGCGVVVASATAAHAAQPAHEPIRQPAQKTAQQDAAASMVKPPSAASGSTGSNNPDNMPIKRPGSPTNDKMIQEPPASGANAK